MSGFDVSRCALDVFLLILAAVGWRRAWVAEHGASQEASTWEATALALKDELVKRPARAGLTLIELLVTIAIIGIMAGLGLWVMRSAMESARAADTRATIAKLDSIIMRRYESYTTRRVRMAIAPCPGRWPDGTPFTATEQQQWALANQWKRLNCLRDLMRMEMPDALTDVNRGPIQFAFARPDGQPWRTWWPAGPQCPPQTYSVPEPALHRMYAANAPTASYDPAQCLFQTVSVGNPEAMEQFHQSEIGVVDGHRVFIDGWGNPIMWLRWAPGFVAPDSEVQSGNPTTDHDPFDPRQLDAGAFHLIPLIYSGGGARGADGKASYGLDTHAPTAADIAAGRDYYIFAGNPYNLNLGKPIPGSKYKGNIDNHHADRR